MLHPSHRWLKLALQKLKAPSLATYASTLRTLARYIPLASGTLASHIADALASYSEHVSPSRVWSTISALHWATRLKLLPPLNLDVCRAIAQGISSATPTDVRQLWFHPSDLGILSSIDPDFETAAHLPFDLMLRGGQLELLRCSDLDFQTESVWCPSQERPLSVRAEADA